MRLVGGRAEPVDGGTEGAVRSPLPEMPESTGGAGACGVKESHVGEWKTLFGKISCRISFLPYL